MTETTVFNYVNIENICRVCYRSDLGVHLASFEELSAIQTLTLEHNFPSMEPLYFCLYCSAILKKSASFVKQCSKACELLSWTSKENTTIKCTNYNNMSVQIFNSTSIDENPICPTDDIIKEEVLLDLDVDGDHNFGDDDDLPLKMLKDEENVDDLEQNTSSNSTNFNHISMKILNSTSVNPNPICPSDEKIKNEALVNQEVDDDRYGDVDDLPLATLKDEEDPQEKSKHIINTTNIENLPADDVPHNAEGVNRNGSVFSKRMVRETEQYLVIKLTKEEVLQEINEKLLSEKYLSSRYKCDQCAKDFNFEDVLRNHMEKHSQKSGYLLCDLCQQYFPSPVSLRGHMKSHTTRYKCKLCGVIKKARQHLLEHYSHSHCGDNVKYTCDLCSFVTNKRTVIQRHTRTHGPSKGHKCDMCGKICKTLEALRVHRIRHDTSKQFQCPTCPRRFVYPTLLKRHVREAHELAHNYCVECDRTFTAKESLQNHFKKSKKHRDSPAYDCKSCPAKFETRSQLTLHRTRDHGDLAVTYQCDSCPKKYKCKETLRSHIRRVHNKTVSQRKYTCNQCDKEFTQKHSLTRHLRTHTNTPRRRHSTHTKKPEVDSKPNT